ncbi:hypothetical protein AB0I84_47615 [Streptomyces spectabilis]|uniref:hypothetical protein n=1 Tax=Streptomyces spectabilis TaxID=68270 RepID=UPI0033DD77DD
MFDKGSQMVGVVQAQHGARVTLKRPSGLRWDTRAVAVRPASDREKIQLAALVKHNRSVQGFTAIRGGR